LVISVTIIRKHVKMSIYLIFRGHFVCKHGDVWQGDSCEAFGNKHTYFKLLKRHFGNEQAHCKQKY